MSKIHALITTIVLGLSTTAVAAPSVTFRADAHVDVRLPVVTAKADFGGPVIRDHRQPQRPSYQRPSYERPTYNQPSYYRLDVSGRYDSNYGKVTLQQNGSRVTGSYLTLDGLRGTIDGTIDNRGVIRFSWNQPSHIGMGAGHGVWTVDRFGDIDGTWGLNTSFNDSGKWTLTAR